VAVKFFCFDTSQLRVSCLGMRWFVRREMAGVEGRFGGAVRYCRTAKVLASELDSDVHFMNSPTDRRAAVLDGCRRTARQTGLGIEVTRTAVAVDKPCGRAMRAVISAI
jgi:hypothetical protein